MPMTKRLTLASLEPGTDEDAAPMPSSSSDLAPTSNSQPPSLPESVPLYPASLPKEPRLRRIPRRKENLNLKCQWPLCSYEVQSMHKFNRHVAKHVPISLDPGNTLERCHWADCSFQSSDGREMKRHVLYHAYHAKLMCIGTSVLERNSLPKCTLSDSERHLLPSLKDVFVCRWEGCSVEFDDPQSYFWHVEHHVNCHYLGEAIDRTHRAACFWDDCRQTAPTFHRMLDHLHVHTGERYLACPNCGILFANNQKFADHVRRQMPLEEQRFQCSHCLKLYATERLLRSHIPTHINTIRCEQCAITLPNARSLDWHILYKHNDERPYPCPKCKKCYKTPRDLRMHIQRHEVIEGGQKFPCTDEGCRLVFLNRERLKKHYNKVHSGEPRPYYFCHLCDARYKSAHSITRHLKKFHNLALPEGHCRFRYRRDTDGHFRLQTLRYESLEVAEQAPAPPADPAPSSVPPVPDVLALSCQEQDVPDSITTDDGRELHLPEPVQRALATGRRVLVCVQGDWVQLLARMDAIDELRNPDDPDALMMVVDGQAVADGPAAGGH